MPKTKNISEAEKLANEVLIEADQLTAVTEQLVKERLSEIFSPNVKKAMNKVIRESVGSSVRMREEEEGDELSDEDLEDLESALEEGEDDFDDEEDFEDMEDVEVDDSEEEDLDEGDYSEELDDEEGDEEIEEGDMASYDDEDGYDFLEELRELLEADEEEDDVDLEDLEDMDEGEDGGSYTEKAPKVKMDEGEDLEDMDEGEDGGSYTEKAPKVKMDEEMEAILSENKRLKRSLKKALGSIKESNLDTRKMDAIDRIITERQVDDRGKLRITSAIDKAKNEKDIAILETALKRQYPKRKRKVNESSRKSLANKSRRQKATRHSKKRVNESKKILGESFTNRWAEIAGISEE